VVLGPELLPGGAVGLAGEACGDELAAAAPRFRVERREVVPDRGFVEAPVLHAGDEDSLGVWVSLDPADDVTPQGSGEAEFESTDTGTKRQATQGSSRGRSRGGL
jgi:hypothetical protein